MNGCREADDAAVFAGGEGGAVRMVRAWGRDRAWDDSAGCLATGSKVVIDDGLTVGVSTAEADRIKQLEQEIRELQRANEILKRAASFFGAEQGRQHKR